MGLVFIDFRNVVTGDILYNISYKKKKRSTLKNAATAIMLKIIDIWYQLLDQKNTDRDYYSTLVILHEGNRIYTSYILELLSRTHTDKKVNIIIDCTYIISNITLMFYISYQSLITDNEFRVSYVNVQAPTTNNEFPRLSVDKIISWLSDHIKNNSKLIFRTSNNVVIKAWCALYYKAPIAYCHFNSKANVITLRIKKQDFATREIHSISSTYYGNGRLCPTHPNSPHFPHINFYIENI